MRYEAPEIGLTKNSGMSEIPTPMSETDVVAPLGGLLATAAAPARAPRVRPIPLTRRIRTRAEIGRIERTPLLETPSRVRAM